MECCSKPNVARFDYRDGGELVRNRVCLACGTHWWGSERYTREEWAALMNSAMTKEAAA